MSSTSKKESGTGNRAGPASDLPVRLGAQDADAWLERDSEPGPASLAAVPTPRVSARWGRRTTKCVGTVFGFDALFFLLKISNERRGSPHLLSPASPTAV